MFDSAHAVPASTVTSRVATAADIVAFRDNHFFIVILPGVIDARGLCRSRRQFLTASPSLSREPGSAGAAYEVHRSGNVREIVPQVAPTSSRSGWPALSRNESGARVGARPRWRRERQTGNVCAGVVPRGHAT